MKGLEVRVLSEYVHGAHDVLCLVRKIVRKCETKEQILAEVERLKEELEDGRAELFRFRLSRIQA